MAERLSFHVSFDPSRPEAAAQALLDQATDQERTALAALAVAMVAEWERRVGVSTVVVVPAAVAAGLVDSSRRK